jgi:RHS Repeat
MTYDARGNVLAAAYANGVTTANTFDAARGWLTGVATAKGATILQSLSYARDAAGRITSRGAAYLKDGWTYAYDDLDRLLSATNSGDSSLSQSFAYDAAHNMTGNSALAGAYVYPAQGAAAVRPHAATQAGPFALTYDANGNRLSKTGAGKSESIVWDGENRPASISENGVAVTFTYAPDGSVLRFYGDMIRIAVLFFILPRALHL